MRRTADFVVLLVISVLLPSSARAQGTETVIYYHTDAIGSVRMTTDASGQVIERYDYGPFGEPWPSQTQPETRRFADHELDHETQLNYFGARQYHSQTGRFTRADDPGYGEPSEPQSMNLYAYAQNNPLKFVDPEGHQAVIVIPYNPGYETICGPDTVAGECSYGFLKFWLDAFARPWETVGRPLMFPETPREIAASLIVTTVAGVVLSGGTGTPAVTARATGLIGRALSSRALAAALRRDATGKIHGLLPSVQQLKQAPLATVREAAKELRASILARKQELARLGEHGPHRARIGEEERLLRSLEKHLENVLGAKNVR